LNTCPKMVPFTLGLQPFTPPFIQLGPFLLQMKLALLATCICAHLHENRYACKLDMSAMICYNLIEKNWTVASCGTHTPGKLEKHAHLGGQSPPSVTLPPLASMLNAAERTADLPTLLPLPNILTCTNTGRIVRFKITFRKFMSVSTDLPTLLPPAVLPTAPVCGDALL